MAAKEKQTITFPIGKWYFKRMTLLSLLLMGFAGWFFYDAKVGYPRAGFLAVVHEAFEAGNRQESWDAYSTDPKKHFVQIKLDEQQLAEVKAAHAEGSKKQTWRDFAREEKFDDLAEPAEEAENRDLYNAFEAGRLGGNWESYAQANGLASDAEQPDERVNRLMAAFRDAAKPRKWALFAAEKDWPSKPPHFHGEGDIFEQFVIASGCAAGSIFVLLLTVFNRKRSVTADAAAYYPKPSIKVPFSSVFRIDTRKWRKKGLAYAYYRDPAGEQKKAILDDLKFAGSQEILDRMLKNFEGELIEEILDEDEVAPGAQDIRIEKLAVEKVKVEEITRGKQPGGGDQSSGEPEPAEEAPKTEIEPEQAPKNEA